MVKVFYLNNVLTAQEMQEIVTAVRTVAEIQKIFTYQAQNAIIVRAEADKVALAEKIIADLDKPKVRSAGGYSGDAGQPEQGARSGRGHRANRHQFTHQLYAAVEHRGARHPRSTTARGPTGTTAAATTSIPLSNIGQISTRDFSLTLPGGLLEALLSDTNTKVLQSPQVRAVDGQKVSLKIGDKVPYATGSFQPGIGGVGINPLVNTQFTFLDVGVNVDIIPKIHGTDEVSLHVEVDISNVKQFLNLGGVNEPDVAQTKIINDVRLRQGEVNLMGGLMQMQENKTVTGVPGLGSIPRASARLFTSETVTKDESELVIALIPHIVRAPDITDVNLRTIAAGNSTTS